MVSELFDSGKMKIESVLSQNEELESSEDLEYVEAKLEKIQEHFGSINKHMQTMMKKLDQLIKLQDDNLKKMSLDDSNSNSGRGKKAVIQNDRFYTSKSPDPIMIAKSDPNLSPDVYPDPYPRMNPKSDSDLNQKLGTNFEPGIAMDAEAIEGEDFDDEGDYEKKEKREENRREITYEREEDRSYQNLGRRPLLMQISPPYSQSPLPISLPPPPSRSSSLPSLWSNLLLHLSSSCPSTNVTQAVNKVCNVGSGNLFRNGRVQKLSKPNLVILSRPKPNPMVLIWPKLSPDPVILIWPKPVPNLIQTLIFTSNLVLSSIDRRVWLVDVYQRLLPLPSQCSSSRSSSSIPGFKPSSKKIEMVGEQSSWLLPPPSLFDLHHHCLIMKTRVAWFDCSLFGNRRSGTTKNWKMFIILSTPKKQKMAECEKLTSKKSQTKRDLEIFFSEFSYMEVDEKKSQDLLEFSKFGEILKSRFGNLGIQRIQPEGLWLGNVHAEPRPPPLPPPLPPSSSTVINITRLHRNFYFFPP